MDHHLPRAVTPRVAPKHTGVVRSDMLGFERIGGTLGGAYVGVMAIAELLRAPAAVHAAAQRWPSDGASDRKPYKGDG